MRRTTYAKRLSGIEEDADVTAVTNDVKELTTRTITDWSPKWVNFDGSAVDGVTSTNVLGRVEVVVGTAFVGTGSYQMSTSVDMTAHLSRGDHLRIGTSFVTAVDTNLSFPFNATTTSFRPPYDGTSGTHNLYVYKPITTHFNTDGVTPFCPLQYMRVAHGDQHQVFLRGRMVVDDLSYAFPNNDFDGDSVTDDITLARLPLGYRPAAELNLIGHRENPLNEDTRLVLYPSGELHLIKKQSSDAIDIVTLDNINFWVE